MPVAGDGENQQNGPVEGHDKKKFIFHVKIQQGYYSKDQIDIVMKTLNAGKIAEVILPSNSVLIRSLMNSSKVKTAAALACDKAADLMSRYDESLCTEETKKDVKRSANFEKKFSETYTIMRQMSQVSAASLKTSLLVAEVFVRQQLGDIVWTSTSNVLIADEMLYLFPLESTSSRI